jgi:hypothetical protein
MLEGLSPSGTVGVFHWHHLRKGEGGQKQDVCHSVTLIQVATKIPYCAFCNRRGVHCRSYRRPLALLEVSDSIVVLRQQSDECNATVIEAVLIPEFIAH